MKKTIIYLCVLCALCLFLGPPAVQGANEIRAFVPGVSNCYSVVREIDGDVWYIVGDTFEVWGGGAARTMADYDITLTDKSGDMFVGDMDGDISTGQYHIVTYIRVGDTAADTDPAVWQEYGDWDGTTWTPSTITAADIADAVWDEAFADHTTETTFGGEVGGLDPNITLILADTDDLETEWNDGGRLDLLVDAIKYKTDLITILDTTVSDANDANSFTLTDGIDVNDAFWFNIIMVTDADDSHSELRYLDEWLSTRVVLVDEPFGFTPAVGDVVHIMGTGYGGLLYRIYDFVRKGSVPNYYIDTTTTGASSRQDVTHFDQTGDDP